MWVWSELSSLVYLIVLQLVQCLASKYVDYHFWLYKFFIAFFFFLQRYFFLYASQVLALSHQKPWSETCFLLMFVAFYFLNVHNFMIILLATFGYEEIVHFRSESFAYFSSLKMRNIFAFALTLQKY